MLHSWLSSWSYLQLFDYAGKACLGQTLAVPSSVTEKSFLGLIPGRMPNASALLGDFFEGFAVDDVVVSRVDVPTELEPGLKND